LLLGLIPCELRGRVKGISAGLVRPAGKAEDTGPVRPLTLNRAPDTVGKVGVGAFPAPPRAHPGGEGSQPGNEGDNRRLSIHAQPCPGVSHLIVRQ